jgi:hypothetical protein
MKIKLDRENHEDHIPQVDWIYTMPSQKLHASLCYRHKSNQNQQVSEPPQLFLECVCLGNQQIKAIDVCRLSEVYPAAGSDRHERRQSEGDYHEGYECDHARFP